MEIEIRAGFCDPDGELVAGLDRPEWQRVNIGRKGEIVDEIVSSMGCGRSKRGGGAATARRST